MALAAVLGVLALLLIQGRGDTYPFGRNPGLFCSFAGGERSTTPSSGKDYCVFWLNRDLEGKRFGHRHHRAQGAGDISRIIDRLVHERFEIGGNVLFSLEIIGAVVADKNLRRRPGK